MKAFYKFIDINEDGYADISIRLNNIVSNNEGDVVSLSLNSVADSLMSPFNGEISRPSILDKVVGFFGGLFR